MRVVKWERLLNRRAFGGRVKSESKNEQEKKADYIDRRSSEGPEADNIETCLKGRRS